MSTQTIYETGIHGNDGLSYNIQVRQCEDGSVQQRHIWHRDQLGEHNPPRIDDWISSYTRDLASMTRGMTPVPEPRQDMAGRCATCHEHGCDCPAEQWLGAA